MLTNAFESAKVLVIGDVMLDRYIWGDVRRISPEAPVPVVKMRRTTETLGGAGNVANNLAGLGCQVALIGVCGSDPAGASLKETLDRKKITSGLVCVPARPTIAKTRIMAHKQQVLRLDEEQVDPLPADVVEQIGDRVKQALPGCRAVILSDYGKGMFVEEAFTQRVIGICRDNRVPVLVDPKGIGWERYRHATCITPNTAELEALVGRPLADDEKRLIAAAGQTRARYHLDWLLVTRGEKGMCLMGKESRPILISSQALEVFDVSGAGDTVIATLAAALAVNTPFVQAAETANLAAGVVVGKLGTQPIEKAELAACLRYRDGRRHFPYAAAKMAEPQGAMVRVAEWRAAEDVIVFTNGCFDLLHPGHISLLHQASALGNRLIVGLNTDASVKRLKGAERPILSEQDRGAILSALACVDLVVLFDDDTPLGLIESLQPDILVKGSDYSPDQVVGKAEVESYGGRVELVNLVEGYSTTHLTRKMRSSRS
jgi:D-beta-D-heptose 7-phosphate kinase/D-beta-D-heptose 1-phosphate adenosyltransferase